MMKRSIRILCLLLALLLCACVSEGTSPYENEEFTAAEPDSEGTEQIVPVTIVIASDLHYISQLLTDNGPFFQRVSDRGDGKLMLYIEPILEAFTEEMIRLQPDVLILSGDLTFNGAYQSHVDLTEKLARIEQAGVRVLAIPGNHDLVSQNSARFEGTGYELVKNINAKEFVELYVDFGYREADSFDPISFSYTCKIGSDLKILMLDTNSNIGNYFPSKSIPWLEQQLQLAGDEGAYVITVSHQNLRLHNSLFRSGYRISNGLELQQLVEKYGVIAHLSGHMHIQHLETGDTPEILTSPLSLTPCRYGLLVYDGERLSYEAKRVDVSAWAREQGRDDLELLTFDSYAEDYFHRLSYRQILDSWQDSGLPDDTLTRMAQIFADANLAYFTGKTIDRETLSADLEYWIREAGEGLETAYLRSILEDDSPSPLKIELWSKESS